MPLALCSIIAAYLHCTICKLKNCTHSLPEINKVQNCYCPREGELAVLIVPNFSSKIWIFYSCLSHQIKSLNFLMGVLPPHKKWCDNTDFYEKKYSNPLDLPYLQPLLFSANASLKCKTFAPGEDKDT